MASRLRPRLLGMAFAAAWRILPRVPEPIARGGFALAADATWALRGAAVRQLEKNLARIPGVEGQRAARRLARGALRSYMRYYCDLFRMPAWGAERLDARTEVHHLDRLEADLEAGTPVSLALGHVGNWDQAGAWGARHVAPVVSVAEHLEPETVFQEFLAARERLGMRIIPLTRGRSVYSELLGVQAERPPRITALLCDRDLSRRGIPVTLCGHEARIAAGPAALAVDTGAALHVAGLHYAPRRRRGFWGAIGLREQIMHLDFSPRIDVPLRGERDERIAFVCQAIADQLTLHLAVHPSSWHMLQKVFTEDLAAPRRPAAGPAARTGGAAS